MTPAILSLKDNFPNAKLSFIHSPWVKNITQYLKAIDDFIEFDIYTGKNIFLIFISALKLILILRKNKFDMVFLGHRNSLFGIILFLAGIKKRLGFRGTMFINYSADFDMNISEPKRYLKILSQNNFQISSQYTYLDKPKNVEEIKKNLKIQDNEFVIGLFPFGGVNPGTDMQIKRWESKKYIDLINIIKQNYTDIKIILFEGIEKNENWNYERDEKKYMVSKIVLEKISICDLFICGDTGPLHIAAAFGVSTLSIFGPSSPLHLAPENNPLSKSIHEYIWKKPDCSPCYTPETAYDRSNSKHWKDNKFICYKNDVACIKNISVEEVFEKVSKILNRIK